MVEPGALPRRPADVLMALRGPARDHAGTQAVRYVAVGGAGYVLAMACYALLLALGVPAYPAVAIVFVLNGIFNFVAMRAWAFPASGRAADSEARRFVAVALLTLVANYATFALLYDVAGVPALPAQAATIVIVAPIGFLANRLWSFRRSG